MVQKELPLGTGLLLDGQLLHFYISAYWAQGPAANIRALPSQGARTHTHTSVTIDPFLLPIFVLARQRRPFPGVLFATSR